MLIEVTQTFVYRTVLDTFFFLGGREKYNLQSYSNCALNFDLNFLHTTVQI